MFYLLLIFLLVSALRDLIYAIIYTTVGTFLIVVGGIVAFFPTIEREEPKPKEPKQQPIGNCDAQGEVINGNLLVPDSKKTSLLRSLGLT